jgi:hypothetical protein
VRRFLSGAPLHDRCAALTGTPLSPNQTRLVDDLAGTLAELDGVEAVVLGGSFARGRAQPGSDIDIGIYYHDANPFDVEALRALTQPFDPRPGAVVTDFYQWGPWVNGGAWLRVEGQRVDLLYRSLEHVGRVIEEARAGEHTLHFGQQPPFGFFSGTYLGEIEIARPLHDPRRHLARLRERALPYPEALRRAVVADHLRSAEFNLAAFAPKFAARGDAVFTSACLARATYDLVLVLFALNRTHLVNDKTALAEITGFELAPDAFAARADALLGQTGNGPARLAASVQTLQRLVEECGTLAGDLRQASALP